MTALALAAFFLSGCHPAQRAPLDLAIQFTCDTHGRLVPCGCFTGQYGGLSRLRTALAPSDSGHNLRVDVGDAIAGTEDFHLIEYRQILRAYGLMKFDALNLGQREARLPVAQLRELAKSSAVPLISANLLDRATGRPVCAPFQIIERAGWRIGVIGVVDPRGLGDGLGEGLEVEKMESALGRLLPEVRKQADAIVLLAFTDEGTLARLAAEFYEADIILGGKVSQPAQKLERHNRSLVSFVTNESRALGLLRVRLGGATRLVEIAHEIRLLSEHYAEANDVRQLAAAYRDEVRQARLAIDAPERLTENLVPGVRRTAEFIGSDTCLGCHPASAKSWRESGHAHAFASLERNQAAMDPKCVGCHTVGFGHVTGYRREFSGAKLANVGCESCHGPGSLHVQQYRDGAPIQFKFRPLGAGDCQKCHYGEFSRPFDWDKFWPGIRHGREKSTASIR
jgi:hypothetical protein